MDNIDNNSIFDKETIKETETEKENNDSEPEDDGSLKFLKLERSEGDTFLIGEKRSQRDLLNQTFWILDFVEDVQTTYTKKQNKAVGQTIVQITFDDPNSDDRVLYKFFTGSKQITSKLQQIREKGKFPRRVTLKVADCNIYYIE